MRIVTWNCGMALARKAPDLMALKADIAVIQECSRKSVDVLHAQGFSGLWFGANPNKGVAVFGWGEWTLEMLDEPFGKWVIPVRVHGVTVDFNLLAIWALSSRDQACRQLHRGGPPMSRGTKRLVRQGARCRRWRLKQQFPMGCGTARTKSYRSGPFIRESRFDQRVPHALSREARGRNAPNLLFLSPSGQAVPHRLRFCPKRLEVKIGQSRVVPKVDTSQRPRSVGG
jgi:hypothetical protein